MSGNHAERRAHIRKRLPFPVTARGKDATGAVFECAAMLHDIGEGGGYMRLTRCVAVGAELVVRISMSPIPQDSSAGAQVSTNGRVLRSTPRPLGTCDVAIRFSQPLKVDMT